MLQKHDCIMLEPVFYRPFWSYRGPLWSLLWLVKQSPEYDDIQINRTIGISRQCIVKHKNTYVSIDILQ